MATKKAPAEKTVAPAARNTASAPAKKTVATKKMTKAELVRLVAEKMEIPTKQSAAFFDLLAETAIQETKKNGEFTIPGLGKLVKAQTRGAGVDRNEGASVCLLDVPANKTSGAYTKPVHGAVREMIEAWQELVPRFML